MAVNQTAIVAGHTVDVQLLADTLITAVEGGIEYWCDVVSYTHTEGPEYTRAEVIEEDGEDAQHFTINTEVIRIGIERMLATNPGEFHSSTIHTTFSMAHRWLLDSVKDNDATMIDADVADLVVQFGLFNETRYG